MNWITNLEGAGTITPAGTRGGTAMNGNFVMYQAGKILCVGGAPSYSLVRFKICPMLLSVRWRWDASGPSCTFMVMNPANGFGERSRLHGCELC
jgi:hypothetical protein